MTSARSARPSASRRQRLIRFGLAGTLALITALSGLTFSSAAAEPVSEITISRSSPSPQLSGNVFTYAISYQCSDVDGASCDDGVITVPLGAVADFDDIDVTSAAGLADSWEIIGGNLVIQLPDSVDAGTSGTIQLQFTPPNHTTPDKTTWELEPTVTGSNFDDATAPDPADGEATADITPALIKTRDKAFKERGEQVTWTVRSSCRQPTAGNLFAGKVTVVDRLDPGFEFDSASGGGVLDTSVTPNTVTWTYEGDDIPTSCREAGALGAVEETITGRVAADFPINEKLPNSADLTVVSFDSSKTKTVTSNTSVTVIDAGSPPGPGGITKHGYGQLAGPGTADQGGGENGSFQSTYPGRWTALLGKTNMNGKNGLINSIPTSAYYTAIDGSEGRSNEVRDAMPCLDNASGVQYESQLDELCEHPAFHPTTVQVGNNAPGNSIPPSDFQPRAILTDGSSVDLDAASTAGVWHVPSANVGEVAEIILPRYEVDKESQLIWIEGYADASLKDGDVLHNVVDVDQYFDTTKIGDLRDSGDIFVIDQPQVGIVKKFGDVGAGPGGSTMVGLAGTALNVTGEPTNDLVIADLLPDGMTWFGDPEVSVGLQKTTIAGSATNDMSLVPELVDNYLGTGRQLVRFTITQSELEDFPVLLSGAGKYLIQRLAFPVTTPSEPGVYDNVADVFYDSANLGTHCLQKTEDVVIEDDPNDLDGDGEIRDRHCEAPASLTVLPSNVGPDFKVVKTVQGSSDAAPRTWPAYGTVDEQGGTVEFGLDFKNIAATRLNGAVLYDVLPHIGDVAVSGALAGQPRNSEFTPLLTGVDDLPAGVSLQYSTAENPCRPEVFPNADNPGCVDDWAETAPADLGEVTGLRFTSDEEFAAGEGFRVTYDMTTPSIDANQFAWNSVAARATNAVSGTPMLASEPPKVGITADTTVPPIIIDKTVDKDTALPGDVLTYTVSISNSGLTNMNGVDLVDTLPAGVEFTSATGGGVHSGGKIRWDDLSLASGETKTFTVEVVVQSGASGTLMNRVEVEDKSKTVEALHPCEDDPKASCAPTTVPSQDLTVEKVVTGDAAAHADGPYTVSVDCRIGGASVTGFPQDVEFTAAGQSDAISVPIGARCTATETDDGGATSNTVSPVDGVLITNSSTAEFKLTVTNTFDDGALVINKHLTGAGAGEFGDGPFEFSVVCTFDGRTVYDDSVELQRSGSATTLTSDPITGLPIGASCLVTETDNGGADTTPAPVTVVIAKSTTAPVDTVVADITNAFSAGEISIHKALTGDGSDSTAVKNLEFTVQVTCQIETVDSSGDPVIGTVFSGDVVLKGGQTVKATDAGGDPVLLPLGTHCFADETDAGGADDVTVSHDSYDNAVIVTSGDPDDLQSLTIDVTNNFEERSLTVTKLVEGDAADFATGPYVVSVDCKVNGDSAPGFPKNVTFTAPGGSSPVIAPIGAVCTAVETTTGGATSVVISPASGVTIDPDPATIPAITVTNRFDAGSLIINKELTGAGTASFADGPFEFDVVCSFQGTQIGQRTVELSRVANETTLTSDPIGGLPIGASCTVTETENGGADDTPDPVTVTIAKDPDSNPVDATFAHLTNRFSAGEVAVQKTLTGPGADDVRKKTFTVLVTCQVETVDSSGDPVRGTVFSGPVKIKGGQTLKVTDASGADVQLPLGTHCFAAETDDGGADAVTVSHSSYDDAVLVASGAPDDLQVLSIAVVNDFDEQTPPGGTPPGDNPPSDNPFLPDTGGARLALLFGALGLLLVGWMIIHASRRSLVGESTGGTHVRE